MLLNEHCANWSLTYKHSAELEANELANKIYGDLLHTVGDIVSILVGFQERDPEMLTKALEVAYGTLIKFREDTQTNINFAIADFGMQKELSGDFAYTNLFGGDIVEQLRGALRNDAEQTLVDEYLESGGPEEEDENGHEIP